MFLTFYFETSEVNFTFSSSSGLYCDVCSRKSASTTIVVLSVNRKCETQMTFWSHDDPSREKCRPAGIRASADESSSLSISGESMTEALLPVPVQVCRWGAHRWNYFPADHSFSLSGLAPFLIVCCRGTFSVFSFVFCSCFAAQCKHILTVHAQLEDLQLQPAFSYIWFHINTF